MNRLISIVLVALLSCSCIPARPTGNRPAPRAATPAVQTKSVLQTPSGVSGLEIPAFGNNQNIIKHPGYTSCFNTSYLIPDWVAYELTAQELRGTVKRPKNSLFQPDPSFRGRQPDRFDYSDSGWDKGHMAPCADMKWSDDAMFESFYFTNVCPQNHSMNAGDWQTLEEKARDIANAKGSLYIVCGPIIGRNQYGTIGTQRVVVPDAFFKAFLYKDNSGFHSIAFVMPNEERHHLLKYYALTVNEVEAMTGFDLFFKLSDQVEESVESQLNLADWMIR